MKCIDGKGWFLATISCLAAGENPLEKPHFDGAWDTAKIKNFLYVVEDTGLARKSRRGWMTLEVPILGNLQWKGHQVDKQHESYRTHIRLNGGPVFLEIATVRGSSSTGWGEWRLAAKLPLVHDPLGHVGDFVDGWKFSVPTPTMGRYNTMERRIS